MKYSPFKFLNSYQKEDKDIFFGREKETAQLYNAVHASNLVLLYGASGTGKTSLINCGLGNKFYDTDWLPIFIRKEKNILHSINRAIDAKTNEDLGDDLGLLQKIRKLYLDHYKPIYLIFDQFEELLIIGDKVEQQEFYEQILELLQAGLQCKLLFSIREEYIAALSDFEKVLPSLLDNRLRIERMSLPNLQRVVVGTCYQFNIELVEPVQTVNNMIENIADKQQGVSLTNLQVYLDQLYKTYLEKTNGDNKNVRFSPPLVAQLGRMENVLSDFLDEQLQIIETELEEKKICAQKGVPLEVLFALVTEDATKRSVAREILERDLVRRKVPIKAIGYCLDRFKEIRLLKELN